MVNIVNEIQSVTSECHPGSLGGGGGGGGGRPHIIIHMWPKTFDRLV